jgi:hypothetical protein
VTVIDPDLFQQQDGVNLEYDIFVELPPAAHVYIFDLLHIDSAPSSSHFGLDCSGKMMLSVGVFH